LIISGGSMTNMDDPLSSAKYSVRHANRHIDSLESEIAAFFKM